MEERRVIKMIDEHPYTSEEEQELEDQLSSSGYPISLHAIDGSEELSARHIYSGINFFSDFNDSGKLDIDYLDMACDCALYDALVKRIKISSKNILNPDTPDELRKSSLIQLSDDCERLGKFYWSVGYIHACRVYLDIGNQYSTMDVEGSGALARYFHEEAAKHYYRATMLLNLDESKKMIEIIYKDEGLAACGWDSFEKAKSDVLSHLPSSRTKVLIKEVQKEMGDLLKKGNVTPVRSFGK